MVGTEARASRQSAAKESRADVAGPERVATAPALRLQPLDLLERVHGEPPRSVEPLLVAGPLERSQQRVSVPGRAVADAGAFLQAVRACTPGQLGACKEQLLIEVGGRRNDDSRGAATPLDTDLAVLRSIE